MGTLQETVKDISDTLEHQPGIFSPNHKERLRQLYNALLSKRRDLDVESFADSLFCNRLPKEIFLKVSEPIDAPYGQLSK